MEVVHPRCCGIDVHQASLAVCVAIKEEGKSEKYKLRCGTTSAERNSSVRAIGVIGKTLVDAVDGRESRLRDRPEC